MCKTLNKIGVAIASISICYFTSAVPTIGHECDCDTPLPPAVSCVNFFDPALAVKVNEGSVTHKMPSPHTSNNRKFYALSATEFKLGYNLDLPERREILALQESSMFIPKPSRNIDLTIDWVPDGGGPLLLSALDEDGSIKKIIEFPHPDQSNFLQTDSFKIILNDFKSVQGFILETKGESGLNRLCTSDDTNLMPPPIEDVIISISE